MAKSTDEYTIWYEGFLDIADELERIGSALDGQAALVSGALRRVEGYHAVYHQLGQSVKNNLAHAASACGSLSYVCGTILPDALRKAEVTCRNRETEARRLCHWFGEFGNFQQTIREEGIADTYYAEAQAKRDQEEADRIQAEKDEQKRIQDEADAKAKEEELRKTMCEISPSAAQEYEDRLTEAKFQDLMEAFKDDPEMLEKIKQDYEAWKKAKAAAATVVDELGEIADSVDSDSFNLGSSDYSSDYGSDWASDYGSDYASDWASSDWSSDLLDSGVDSGDYWSADGALDDIMGSTLEDAVAAGVEAAGDAADLAEPGMFDEFGANLASVVQSYGLQAALVVGGGVALYATREQTIEAAAHVAEFVSTKCKPAVNDVMEQVKTMAKQTKVNLGKAKSNVKATVRGEKAGDLID